ncbi:MAG TPA: peptidoglycan DD-metalloendopeptidase family protein [Vicinamibacterales bacterium]|nr:peptidoglycan DD-metalloendopeptidase family protein [Vicinamibacterales bacterium]
MASRCSELTATFAACLAFVLLTAPPSAQDRSGASQRAGERIKALQRESEALAAQESKLLAELRTLELERQARVRELAEIDASLAATEQKLRDTAGRAADLKRTAEAERPDAEARLVKIYKLGSAGYWRLLLDVDDLRSLGRAYRTAAALHRMDRDRVLTHQRTLEALAREQKELSARAAELQALQERARRARAAADRAVAARTALVDSIDARRDLNAQMVGELQAAQQRLQAGLTELAAAGPAAVLPLRPFRGVLPWPAPGRITTRFGRQPDNRFGTAIVRNGIEIAIAEGQAVRAVHEGTVAFADPFTGYGNLVILEHGDRAFSLYGHLSSIAVARGAHVDARARLGTTGRNPSGEPVLYFELRVDGKPVDPLQWLQKGIP